MKDRSQAGIEAEIVDLRCLRPLDMEPVIPSPRSMARPKPAEPVKASTEPGKLPDGVNVRPLPRALEPPKPIDPSLQFDLPPAAPSNWPLARPKTAAEKGLMPLPGDRP